MLCNHHATSIAVFSMHALPRSKIELLSSDFHQFSYSERLMNSKRHLKRSLCIKLEENPLSHVSLRESLLKPKIGIPNLDYCHCFCSKRLFYPKTHLKRNYYMLFHEKGSSSFSRHSLPKWIKLDYQIWTSTNFSAVNNRYVLKNM